MTVNGDYMRILGFFILGISIFLIGCDKQVIKLEGAYDISCEGLERASGLNPVITIGQNVVIKFKTMSGEGLIVAKNCKIS